MHIVTHLCYVGFAFETMVYAMDAKQRACVAAQGSLFLFLAWFPDDGMVFGFPVILMLVLYAK